MSPITTHILDTALGRPAAGVPVTLEVRTAGGGWETLGSGRTDADGRLKTLLYAGASLAKGTYRLTFDISAYQPSFYPSVSVAFRVEDPSQHYHIPLLLAPYGYSTYRGS